MGTLSAIGKWLGDALDWLLAVVKHAGALFFGLLFSSIVFVFEHAKGEPLSWDAISLILFLCIIHAFFASWRDEHYAAVAANAEIERIKSKPDFFAYIDRLTVFPGDDDGNAWMAGSIHITNRGAQSTIKHFHFFGDVCGQRTEAVLLRVDRAIRVPGRSTERRGWELTPAFDIGQRWYGKLFDRNQGDQAAFLCSFDGATADNVDKSTVVVQYQDSFDTLYQTQGPPKSPY